ncbi:MAG: hypothetical protein Q8P67_19275 [archaeon]|nr:hypothetical protein [archaeon]
MMLKKAEGQAARELKLLQQQLAIQQICNAEHRIVLFHSFREYVELLIKHLREVLHSLDVILVDRMAAVQFLSNTIDSLVDSANSAIAASSDPKIKAEIAARSKSVIGISASFMQEGRSAGHSRIAADNFQSDALMLKEELSSFIRYLHTLGLWSDIDNDFNAFRSGVVGLVMTSFIQEDQQTSDAAHALRPAVSPRTAAAPFENMRNSGYVFLEASRPPALPTSSAPNTAMPRRATTTTSASPRPGPPGPPPAVPPLPPVAPLLLASDSPSKPVAMRHRPNTRQVSAHAVKTLNEMEELISQSKSKIAQSDLDKSKRQEIFDRTQIVLRRGSQLIDKMQSACQASSVAFSADAAQDIQKATELLIAGLSAYEESLNSDASVPLTPRSASSVRPPARNSRRAVRPPSSFVAGQTLGTFQEGVGTFAKLSHYTSAAAPEVTSPDRSQPGAVPAALAQAALDDYVHDLGKFGLQLMNSIAEAIRGSGGVCSVGQEEQIAASSRGLNMTFQLLLEQLASAVNHDWYYRAIAALRCLKSAAAHLVNSVRVKLSPEDPAWATIALNSTSINSNLDACEELLFNESRKSPPSTPIPDLSLRLTAARRALFPFRPIRLESLDSQLMTSFTTMITVTSLEVELNRSAK